MSTPKPSKKTAKNAVASSSKKASSRPSSSSAAAAAAPTKSKAAPPTAPDSPFSYRTTQMRLSVPPRFAGDLRAGVEEMLDSMVMRFIPKLAGVLLSHSALTFLSSAGNILYDCPFAVVDVEFGALVWAPRVGQVLTGTHSLSSPSHLSLLIHQTFNVSIPLNHIPPAVYTFDRTLSSKEDDEAEVEQAMLGAGADGEDEDEDDEHEDVEMKEAAEGRKKPARQSEGRWKNAVTGRAVGAEGAAVEFTVVGLTITSHILSLTGSLLADPFNPPAPGPSQSAYANDDEAAFDVYTGEDDAEHALTTDRAHAVVPTQNSAAVSKKQQQQQAKKDANASANAPPKLKVASQQQAPAKARKRAVSVDYSDDSSDDEPKAPAATKAPVVPKTADEIDTDFPLLPTTEAEAEPAKKKSRKSKADDGAKPAKKEKKSRK